jgi:filamentous hemagglutinin
MPDTIKVQAVSKAEQAAEFGAGSKLPCLDELSTLGSKADKGGLTKAGRSLTKHSAGKRPGSTSFPSTRGNPSQINKQAQDVLDDILTDPSSVVKKRPGKAGEILLQVSKPDGTGAIYKLKNGKWEFSHFAENIY